MTIGIDIRVLGIKHKSGIQEYTENLLAHLLPLDSSVKYKLFYSSYKNELPDYAWLNLPNVEVNKFKLPNRLLFWGARLGNYPKIDNFLGGVDLFFSPHFFLAPLSAHVKRATTFHDLSYEKFPEFFSWRKRIWHRLEMQPKKQAQLSDKIIAVSQSTKNDLVEIYDIDPVRISVVHSGVSPSIKKLSREELEEFRVNHRLPKNFILSMGTLEPRKNIAGLIQAFNLVKDSGFYDLELVIAGPRGWLDEEIFAQIDSSSYKNQIKFIDYVNNNERAYYYNLASMLVYPSFFEGFGFPPLEAFKCGSPVIASNNSSLPEVVKDAGILIDPYNISEIAQAIKSILSEPKLKDKLIQKGFDCVQLFNWQKCAQETFKVITTGL